MTEPFGGKKRTLEMSALGRKRPLAEGWKADIARYAQSRHFRSMANPSKIASAAFGAVILLSGCAGSRDLHALPEPAFQAQINQAIPIGTSLDEAEKLLTSRGYSCARQQGPGEVDPVLSCIDQGAPFGSLIERVWFVQFSHDPEGNVVDIDVHISRAFAL